MSYGLRYTSQFDSFKPLHGFQIDIYKKDYTGEPDNFLVGETPAVQEWQDDDPKMPIRGCTLKVSIITDENGLRLKDFYSEDDNEYKCIFRDTISGIDLFSGYLLQDECAEIMVDFNHEIQLTFTDQLGILKDITLDQAAVNIGTLHTETGVIFYNPTPIANNTICSFDTRVSVLKNGDTFRLFDGVNTYDLTCYNISYSSLVLGYSININEPCPFVGQVTFDFTYWIPYPLTGYIPLIDILKLCIKSTNLELPFTSLVNIYPKNGTNERIWDDTFVDASTFFDGEVWQDCYTILENLMSRFNACLFQAYNRWYIIRWDEMYKYTTNQGATYPGHNYDLDFNFVTNGGMTQNFIFFSKTDLETGVIGSIVRPYQYIKESFNYQQPTDLLKNPDLQELGNFRTEYIDANNDLIKEYDAPYWQDQFAFPGSPSFTRFIRIAYNNDITSDDYGNEKYRFLVLTGVGTYMQAAVSNNIYLSKGDSVSFSVDVASGYNLTGPADMNVLITFQGVTNLWYLDLWGYWQIAPPTWSPFINYQRVTLTRGQNLNDGINWNLKVIGVPEDGILNWGLFNYSNSANDEIYYQNFSFSVSSYYSGYKKVTGQTHTDTNFIDCKNSVDKEIYFDDSPSWYIKGTLYNEQVINGLRQKCVKWTYPGISYPYKNLGLATTQELLFSRYKPRTKYEGTLLYIKKQIGEQIKFVTPLSVFLKKDELNQYRFLVGKLAINYKTATCDLTFYEHIDNMGGDFNGGIILEYLDWASKRIYEFNYIFDKR